ncbi:death-associated protein 1 isoform X2 [Petaurus breviceps papuanus]|uniref:death-associated protein 1 isoform X2 n=1 Tax=Petaurus breviceps papuanus TaxID=3040969 RepID=UPI0036D8DB51
MSSPTDEKVETRAGHPPAVKAGGMRIVQKHPHSGDAKEEKDKDDQEWESTRNICRGDMQDTLNFPTQMKVQVWTKKKNYTEMLSQRNHFC